MDIYICGICGWTYDEEDGLKSHGIEPGTKWEDVASDFKCPPCGMGKEVFTKM